MKRHHYISDDLNELETVERDLEDVGVATPQLHVFSEDDAGVQTHQLHTIAAVLKRNVVHGTAKGAVIGTPGAMAVLILAWISGLNETYIRVTAIFLTMVVLGFCTWEGGRIGTREPHVDIRRIQDDLRAGKHILFGDADCEQEPILRRVLAELPTLQDTGEGAAKPRVVVRFQDKFASFMKLAP